MTPCRLPAHLVAGFETLACLYPPSLERLPHPLGTRYRQSPVSNMDLEGAFSMTLGACPASPLCCLRGSYRLRKSTTNLGLVGTRHDLTIGLAGNADEFHARRMEGGDRSVIAQDRWPRAERGRVPRAY